VIYFKKLYPKAKIIAFEPDKEIFAMLQENVGRFDFSDVTLKSEAVWVNNDTLHFRSQGGLSGQLTRQSSGERITDVKGFRLNELLNQPVDFLKIDIEGAESEVLQDCKDQLQNVANIFVEYHSRSDGRQKLDEILSIFTNVGFRYQIHEAFVSPNPYLNIDKLLDMDLQLNIFGYRA
jgi:FkbM family methyltransferase